MTQVKIIISTIDGEVLELIRVTSEHDTPVNLARAIEDAISRRFETEDIS